MAPRDSRAAAPALASFCPRLACPRRYRDGAKSAFERLTSSAPISLACKRTARCLSLTSQGAYLLLSLANNDAAAHRRARGRAHASLGWAPKSGHGRYLCSANGKIQ